MRNQSLEQNRQESLRVWADRQRQSLHEAFKNTTVNQPVAGLGTGAGGSFNTQLPLESVQITTLMNVEDGKWVIHVVNHTTGQTYQTDSGYDDTWYFNGSWGAADGYTVMNLWKPEAMDNNLYRFLIISPEGQITSTISSTTLGFPNYDYNIYYGGGISVLLANDSNRTAVFYYFYNGQMWLHQWEAGTWFGFDENQIGNFNWGTSKNGTIWISTRESDSNHNNEVRAFGPGVATFSSKYLGLFTEYYYGVYYALPYNDEGLTMNKDGTLSNNAKSEDGTWFLYRENISNGLSSLYIASDSFVDYWDCLGDIQSALSNLSTAIDTESLFIDDIVMLRSGNDLFLVIGDGNGDYWALIIDLNTRTFRLVTDLNNLLDPAGSLDLADRQSTLNSVFISYDYDDDLWDFNLSSSDYQVKVLWSDSNLDEYTIPHTIGGTDFFLCTYNNLSDSLDKITLIGFVSSDINDFYKITLTKGQSEPVLELIPGFNGMDSTSVEISNCYNDIKGEWFTKITNRRPTSYKYLIVDGTTGSILNNKTINLLEGGSSSDIGVGYAPVFFHTILGGVRKIWCLDYNTYTWNLAIDTTSTPTYDSQLVTYLEPYDAGYDYGWPGGSRWLFIDPDFPRSWIITSKYGAVYTESLPLIGGPWPNNIGQVYAQSYQVETGGVGATAISTGEYSQYNLTEPNCEWFNPAGDRFIYVGQKPTGGNTVDVFTGPVKVLTLEGEPYWAFNDVTYNRAID